MHLRTDPDVNEGETLIMPENTSILNALKLTGKNKSGLSLGIVNSITAKETATIKSADEEIKQATEPFTNYFTGRIKQDFNKGSTTIGAILNSTIRKIDDDPLDFLAKNSTVGGLDFEHNWLNRKYYFNIKTFASQVNGSENAISGLQRSTRHLYQRADADHLDYNPGLTSLSGWGGEISGGKRSGKLRITGDLNWHSPGVDFNDIGYMRQADYIKQDLYLLYNVNKPKGILLKYYFDANQRHQWSYGGENLEDRLFGHFRLYFKNYWSFSSHINRLFNVLDTRQLRGGPALRIDPSTNFYFMFQTNTSKPFALAIKADITKFDDKISWEKSYDLGLIWVINNRINITSTTGLSTEINNSQYVKQSTFNDERQYIVGKIDRKTLYTTLRAEYFITPELSLQYYGSPYASVGKYLDFRRVEQSRSRDLSKRYKNLTITEIENDKWVTDENMNLILDYANESPDFNFQEFRSNFVLRWEYKTGSTLYFVWTNTGFSYEDKYNPSIWDSYKNISKVEFQNAFMIKLSYWFSL